MGVGLSDSVAKVATVQGVEEMRIAAVVVMLGVLGVGAAGSAGSEEETTAQAIVRYDISVASSWVRRVCRALKTCPGEIVVQVEPDANFPDRVLGHATAESAGVCVIHVNRDTVTKVQVIAHETCHCARDMKLGLLGPDGYVGEATRSAKDASEAAAQSCAKVMEIEAI